MLPLRLRSIAKAYPNRGAVLVGASLTVPCRSLTAVYGAPGAGKSTLLRIAAGLERPDEGEVLLGGVGLDDVTGPRLRRHVAWLQADLDPGDQIDIATHVALPLYRSLGPRAAQVAAERALAAVGARDYGSARWDELSLVGRILVAIARSSALAPRILVADAPTAGLGVVDRERICATLRTLAEENRLAVLMATADLTATLRAHQAVVLSRGRLIAPSDPEGLDADVVPLPLRPTA